MTQERLPWVARMYATALWLLPPDVRRDDGREMVLALADHWAETIQNGGRVRLILRVFRRLVAVAVVEWVDWAGVRVFGIDRGGTMGLRGNVRFAFRTLRRSPAFTLTSVLLIGLGVGSVTTIFTLVDHVLLRPLPYPDADRIVFIGEGSHSGPTFEGWRSLNSLEAWGAARVEHVNFTGVGDPLRLEQAEVSEGFFTLFGSKPAMGRLLTADDFTNPNVAVLSNGTWRDVFGADPGAVGRGIRVDGEPITIVGVLESDFEAPSALVGSHVDLWRPIDWTREAYSSHQYQVLEIAGRARRGVGITEVQSETDALRERLATIDPDSYMTADNEVRYVPIVGLQDSTVASARVGLRLLFGAVMLLLVIACVNVAHLFLARGLGRLREMAVRRALGARTGGLVRQLVVESTVVSMAGGVVGILIAGAGLEIFFALNPSALPRAAAVTLDARVVLFSSLLSLAAALVFGLIPALSSMHGDVADELRGSSSGATSGHVTGRLRSGLVVGEVALSLVLVAAAGLLLKSFLQVRSLDAGIVAEGVWTIPLTPTGISEPIEYVDAMNRIEASLASLPGVRSATYGLTLPMEMTGGSRCCWMRRGASVDGELYEGFQMILTPVSTDFFTTLGIRILGGSVWWLGEESEDPIPAVVSETLAIELFGSADAALGRLIGETGRTQWRVTGVAADTKYFGLDRGSPHALFLPISRVPFALDIAHMAVRIEGEEPADFVRTLREAVWRAAPNLPVPTVMKMDEWIERSTAGRRFDSVLFGAFGVVALVLAAGGLYGTLLYSVRQRRRELGIRLALGAAQTVIERAVVAGGVGLAVAGAVIGLAASWLVGRYLESRLYEMSTHDPTTLSAAALILLGTAAAASWLPARRAARTDPIETLKAE